jgi:broad specificity phosphatase PhoE
MAVAASLPRIHLLRHGETAWSLSGQHTSRTDVPLTAHGEDQAGRLGARLRGINFTHVFTSPRLRAQRTCALAGFTHTEVDDDLREWDYGDYEGLTTALIHLKQPVWNLFVDGAPGGESPSAVFARAGRCVRRLQSLEGDIAIFSHGHFLRVLAAAWVGFPVAHSQNLELSTASHGILSYEHNILKNPSISLWNET